MGKELVNVCVCEREGELYPFLDCHIEVVESLVCYNELESDAF